MQQCYETSTVWYYGGMYYGQGAHSWLLMPTALTVFFILPFIIILTFSYCFMGFRITNKFRPFLDAYGGPFKDKWRFWFGLRLWIMAVLLFVDGTLQGNSSNTMLFSHLVIIFVFVLIQSHVRPFRNQLVGALDTFFMLNYWLIILFYLQSEISKSIFSIAYIFLLSFAIFVLVLIVVFHFLYNWVYLKKLPFFALLKTKLSNKLKKNYDVVINNEGENSDEDLFEAAEVRDHIADTY